MEVSVPASTKQRSSSSGNETANSSANNAVPITTLKNRDIEDIKTLPNVLNTYGVSMGQQVVNYKDVSKNAFIFGASSSRFDVDKSVIEQGRGYTYQEDKSLSQVAVLGNKIAKDLFGNEDPLGRLIRVGNYNFEVIGVYSAKGGFDGSDDQVFIPVTTLQKKIQGIDYLVYAVVQLEDNGKADATSLDIADVLRSNHYISSR